MGLISRVSSRTYRKNCKNCSTMFSSRSEYDRSVNSFSPEGRLFQVEYAIEAIKQGSTAIGIQTSEGVVLAVEKKIKSKLLIAKSMQKVFEIDTHVGCAASGLAADGTTLVDHARVEAQSHWFTYDEPMPVMSIARSVCDLAMGFADTGEEDRKNKMSRPFGVSLLIAGADENGPSLYHTDPSGTMVKYMAKAIGSASESAQTTLQDNYNQSMTLREAETLALKILKQVMESKIEPENVDVASVATETGKYRLYGDDEIKEILSRPEMEDA